jgi:hypothetical protein
MWVSPTGAEIIGTSDAVLCTANITDIEEDGTPVYSGETDVDWDSQTTKERDGKPLFIDDDGQEWTFDQLTWEEDEEGEDD